MPGDGILRPGGAFQRTGELRKHFPQEGEHTALYRELRASPERQRRLQMLARGQVNGPLLEH